MALLNCLPNFIIYQAHGEIVNTDTHYAFILNEANDSTLKDLDISKEVYNRIGAIFKRVYPLQSSKVFDLRNGLATNIDPIYN